MRRGARHNPPNRFDPLAYAYEAALAPDSAPIQVIRVKARRIVNVIDSPDLPLVYSMNPYAGCEHGCIYCYARNSHEYWGFSAGIDFETKILVKENAVLLLRAQLSDPKWRPQPIMLAGNTDCYQPLERDFRLTRQILEVLLEFRHPVCIITKSALILRDIDILSELSRLNLVHVYISVTTLRETLRQRLEPRTATGARRLEVIQRLTAAGVPVGVMVAPLIPGLNADELLPIMAAARAAGARTAAYTIVRLNGAIAEIFATWLRTYFPDRAEKVLRQIAACHGGQLGDSQWGRRLQGSGPLAEAIQQTFQAGLARYYSTAPPMPAYDLSRFRRGGQPSLFETP